jgi:hypothetical protein
MYSNVKKDMGKSKGRKRKFHQKGPLTFVIKVLEDGFPVRCIYGTYYFRYFNSKTTFTKWIYFL